MDAEAAQLGLVPVLCAAAIVGPWFALVGGLIASVTPG